MRQLAGFERAAALSQAETTRNIYNYLEAFAFPRVDK
jgi:hypothetical protein